MKMQYETAKAIYDELKNKLASSSNHDDIELSLHATQLLLDTVARADLQNAIDETN